MRRTPAQQRLFAFGLVLSCLFVPSAAETPEELFNRGNEAYQQEQWDAAAEAYRAILKYRINDPRVEYNLGNAEFRRGNLGRAILHFERARRLAPTDSEIRDNLEFARSFAFDRVEPPEQFVVLAWIYGIQDRVGADRQAWAVVALVWIAGLMIAWWLARPRRWSAIYGWSLTGLLLAFVVVAASWLATHQRMHGARLGVVLSEVVEVRAGPGESNPSLFTIHEGLTIEVRDEREDWVQVSLPNGLSGWLPHDALGLVS